MSKGHLVILKKPYLDAILAGQKTIESRLTKTKRAPFGRIFAGDKLFFKVSSGAVCAIGRVGKVLQFDNLTPERIHGIKQQYNGDILAAEQYWAEREGCKYCVLVWLECIKAIEPTRINGNIAAKISFRVTVVPTPISSKSSN